MRWMGPERAAWSGRSARRVVVSGRRALAVVELCAQRSACLADKGDLICRVIAPGLSSQSVVDTGCQRAWRRGRRRRPILGDPDCRDDRGGPHLRWGRRRSEPAPAAELQWAAPPSAVRSRGRGRERNTCGEH